MFAIFSSATRVMTYGRIPYTLHCKCMATTGITQCAHQCRSNGVSLPLVDSLCIANT